ncbi:unnamed protein product [Choristocarpus tenellus]
MKNALMSVLSLGFANLGWGWGSRASAFLGGGSINSRFVPNPTSCRTAIVSRMSVNSGYDYDALTSKLIAGGGSKSTTQLGMPSFPQLPQLDLPFAFPSLPNVEGVLPNLDVPTSIALPKLNIPTGFDLSKGSFSLPDGVRLPELPAIDLGNKGLGLAKELAHSLEGTSTLDTVASSMANAAEIAARYPVLSGILTYIETALSPVILAAQHVLQDLTGLSPEQSMALVVVVAAYTTSKVVGVTALLTLKAVAGSSADNVLPLPTTYDLEAIVTYYNRRPLTLLSRLASVSYRLGTLALKLWFDRQWDGSGWERNMPARAREFYEFVQGAGPAFIKVGQGISVRPDILPELYLQELVKLQDQVAPFSSEEARNILKEQLGRPLNEIFLDADTAFEKPVAAASLGQVYKATLSSTGQVVAVKVQRPNVLESVTLDLYVIRLILLFVSKNKSTRESALSILGVIDNWAVRFVEELDYLQEARNGQRFREEMGSSDTLGEAIMVPEVFMPLVTRYVLVSQWVEGVKVCASFLSS